MDSILQTIQKDCYSQNEAQTASNMNLITVEKESEIISEETSNEKAASEAVRPKKPRFKWTDERKKKFMHAFNLLGINNVKPLKIMALMDEPGMSRGHVVSYLQKIRREHRANADNGMKGNKHPQTNPSFIASNNPATASSVALNPDYIPNAMSNVPVIELNQGSNENIQGYGDVASKTFGQEGTVNADDDTVMDFGHLDELLDPVFRL